LREFALVGLVEGDWDEVDASLDDILKVEMNRDGSRRVRQALENQFAVLSRGFVGGSLGDIQPRVARVWSRLTGENRHGGDEDVIDEQRQTRDWMPRHLRLVPLADEEGQFIPGNLHVPQFAVGPNAENDGVSREVNVEVRRREDVRIVESREEFVDGRQGESFVARSRVQEAGCFVVRREMSVLIFAVELNGLVRGFATRHQMHSAGQICRKIGPFDSTTSQSVEFQSFGLYRIVKISVKDLRSLQITSFGVINVKILIFGIGKNGGEVLIRGASAQLNFPHGLFGLFEHDGGQWGVAFPQIVDVKSQSVSLRPRQFVESPLADWWQVGR